MAACFCGISVWWDLGPLAILALLVWYRIQYESPMLVYGCTSFLTGIHWPGRGGERVPQSAPALNGGRPLMESTPSYPSALVLAVRDSKASRAFSGGADKNIRVLHALPHSAPSTVATAVFPTYMHQNNDPQILKEYPRDHKQMLIIRLFETQTHTQQKNKCSGGAQPRPPRPLHLCGGAVGLSIGYLIRSL